MKYYLAYGSNLNIQQMAVRCPGARAVGTATIRDFKLAFRGSGTGAYLTLDKCPGGGVPVAVWEINDEHERALDRYEGYPNFYIKWPFTVDVAPLGTVHAFAYIMTGDRPIGVPSLEYVNVCARGFLTFRLDMEVLQTAVREAMAAADAKV